MESNLNIKLFGNDVEISTNNIRLNNSLGFAIFCNPGRQNIEAEISRVDSDLKLISIMEKIDLSEVINIVRSSVDGAAALLKLKNKFGYSDIEAESILNTDLQELGNSNFELYTKRLVAYKNLLKGFLVQ
ncbi:MAG: hypothetical protein HN952_03175 [Candidatus Cloacimonetes bacterium]|jgi:hypothetical protein|nr:hypothetical protein [Candidatus Cloacimonadota bacterium]